MNENKLLDDIVRTPWRAQFHDGRHSGTSCGELRAPRWFRSSGPEPPGPSRSSVRRASVPAAKFVARSWALGLCSHASLATSQRSICHQPCSAGISGQSELPWHLAAAQFVARKAGSAAMRHRSLLQSRPDLRRQEGQEQFIGIQLPEHRPVNDHAPGDPIAGCGPGPCRRYPRLGSRSAPNRMSVRARTKGSPVDHRVAWIPGLRADKWGGESEPGGQSRRVREGPAFTARTKAQAAASRLWPGRP